MLQNIGGSIDVVPRLTTDNRENFMGCPVRFFLETISVL